MNGNENAGFPPCGVRPRAFPKAKAADFRRQTCAGMEAGGDKFCGFCFAKTES
jgi:hypothetical protein